MTNPNPCTALPLDHTVTALPRSTRRAVRALAGNVGRGYQLPIEVIPGAAAPHVAGQSYYHTTPSGRTIVRHPNAYKWRTLYHASTRRVVVGQAWLALQRAAHVPPVCVASRRSPCAVTCAS